VVSQWPSCHAPPKGSLIARAPTTTACSLARICKTTLLTTTVMLYFLPPAFRSPSLRTGGTGARINADEAQNVTGLNQRLHLRLRIRPQP
jgi:hypothetical protein